MRATLVSLVISAACLLAAVHRVTADTGPLTIASMPEPAKLRKGAVVSSKAFGDKFSGRVLWLSANGRYAALFRLTEDTDKNGRLNIEFGMHGDSWGDELSLDVFDIDNGSHQRFDDLLVGDPQGRYLVLARGPDTFLFDSSDGSARDLRELGGDATTDGNLCMSPRQIAFDESGERIALLRDKPAGVVIFTPASGDSREIYRSTQPLWRVAFTSDPARLLATEVRGEFPKQGGSCVSRSRSAFAASYSTTGIDSTLLTYSFIGIDGQRLAVDEAPVLLGNGVYALPGGSRLQKIGGGDIGVPAGCKIIDGADGSRIVELECGSTSELFDPATGLRRVLPAGEKLSFIEGMRAVSSDGTWYAIEFPIESATHRSDARRYLGRLRVEDLRIERGPAVYFWRRSGNPEWLTGGRNDEYFMFHLATGTTYTAHAKDTDTWHDELALDVGNMGPFLLLDPGNSRQAEWQGNVGVGNGRGCFSSLQGKRKAKWTELDPGPWTRICIVAPP